MGEQAARVKREGGKGMSDRDTITGYDFRVDKSLTPAKAIRKRCLHCVGGEPAEVERCTARTPQGPCDPSGCWLWPYRMGRGVDRSRSPKGKRLPTRAQAIRRECLNCMGNSSELVKTCETYYCHLWPYRLGRGICQDPEGEKVITRRPNQKQRKPTKKQLAALREHAKSASGDQNAPQESTNGGPVDAKCDPGRSKAGIVPNLQPSKGENNQCADEMT